MANAPKAPKSTKPTYIAYTVTKGKPSDQGFWTAIGAAWPNKDGHGFNIQLHAIPLDGNIVLREAKDKNE